ncbi:MAG: LacI family DNA-binding transcriptional regulator [Gammaproteobacteria bacterium]|nr:LacI family DNA-binding transcriptional regulator [Gammaproteobacteria bacterium]
MKPLHKATIDDVAELAGVSIKTVSRVVNGEPNVRESTRDKVDKAIVKLKYRPNLSARNLASQRSHLIVLIYDDPSAYEVPSSGYVIRMQAGTLRACRAASYELLIHPCNYRNKNVKAELDAIIEQMRPDGFVIAAPLSNMPKIVNAIASTNTPFVRMSPGSQNGKEFIVATNDREISAEMTRYLAAQGHRRIAFIRGNPKHKAVNNRAKGYKDGLVEGGLKFRDELVFVGDNSIASGIAAAEQLLALEHPPTAIFAANDDMAAGVIRVAYRMGVDIPGQLSVAGFDDSSLAQQIHPTLTTVRQPLAAMAEQAAETLIRHAGKGEMPARTEIVPAALQIRDSTGPAPAD